MKIRIDYICYSEKAYISNSGEDNKLWRSMYTIMCDYIPSNIIDYSDIGMSLSWGYFIRIKGYIVSFIKSHSNEIKLELTDSARKMLNAINELSYTSAIALVGRSKDEIESVLKQVGFERTLTNNQISNLEKISSLPGAATFSVPGAGKTTEALAYFFVNANPKDKLLIVAPKNAFGAWDEQLEICDPNCTDKIVRLRGGEANIKCQAENRPRFSIITYDQLPRVKSVIVEMLSSGNYFVFLDESHRIKGGKTRAEAVLEIAHLPYRKLIMSGTPMPQSPKDLVPQFRFLYPAKDVDENTVIDLIQPLYVRTTKGQLGIPEITHKVVTVKMSDLQRNIYNTLKSEAKRQMNPMITDSSRYELRRIGKCIMKVMQFVSNPSLLAYDMDYAFDRRVGEVLLEADGPKIEYVCKRARELAYEGKKVLIWSSFVQNVELISLRLSDLGAVFIHGKVDAGDENEEDTREGKIKRFHDDPGCMIMVANPAACSEGISLHKVCQNAIYLDRSFNAAHYLQSEDRIHRLGLAADAKPVVEYVECANSIDQVIRERLAYKVNIMADALNDSSLRVNPEEYEYDDENEDDENISEGDAKAIIDYFFGYDEE